jgi:hypothetical protein
MKKKDHKRACFCYLLPVVHLLCCCHRKGTQDPNPSKYGTYYGYYEGFYYYDKDPVLGQVNVSAGGRPDLVIGGKANMWGEHVDANNFMPRVW